MSYINILREKKQFRYDTFKFNKIFKIRDNQTIILYNFIPDISKDGKIAHSAWNYIIDEDKQKLLLGVTQLSLCACKKDPIEKKAQFLFFKDPAKKQKLIWRKIPLYAENIKEAYYFVNKYFKW